MMRQPPRYMCFAGGGTYGLMYIGVHRALSEHIKAVLDVEPTEFFDNIQGFAGVSVGALAALTFMLNLSTESWEAHFETNLKSMRDIMPNPDFTQLLSSYGLDRGAALQRMICDIMTTGGISERATFADIRRLLRKDFICVATDVHTSSPVYFSAETTPGVCISDAIYMSMCVPLLFVPRRHGNRLMADGCLSVQMPRKFPPEETLFMDFDFSKMYYPIENVQDYCIACFSAGSPDMWYRRFLCLTLSVPYDAQTHPCDFAMKPAFFAQRIAGGYAKALDLLYPKFQHCVNACIHFVLEKKLERKLTLKVQSRQASGSDGEA